MLNWGKKEQRLDPAYYIPSIVALEEEVLKKATKNGVVMRLRHYIKNMAGGATPKVEDEAKYSDAENGIPFIRVQNLSAEGVLSLEDVKYISKKTHEKDLKRSAFNDQDLIVKITGVGRMAIASVPNKGCVGNINQHSVRIVTGGRLISETIAAYLNLDFVEKLASRRATGGTRPALDYPALRSIPVIYDERIAKMFKKARETKQKDEKEAQNLLDGIDSYLLSKLGIELPEKPENSIENRKFTKGFYEISGGRLDPFYHQEYFEQLNWAINNSKFDVISLKKKLTFINSGARPKGGVQDIQSGILSFGGEHVNKLCQIDIRKPKYVPLSFHKNNIRTATKLFDIILVKDGATTGKIGIIENNDYVDMNINEHVFILRFDGINHHFLTFLLNTKLYQDIIKREITGSTVTGISKHSVRNISIPLPSDTQQGDIANDILHIRDNAFEIIDIANLTFSKNKSKIEQLILSSNE